MDGTWDRGDSPIDPHPAESDSRPPEERALRTQARMLPETSLK